MRTSLETAARADQRRASVRSLSRRAASRSVGGGRWDGSASHKPISRSALTAQRSRRCRIRAATRTSRSPVRSPRRCARPWSARACSRRAVRTSAREATPLTRVGRCARRSRTTAAPSPPPGTHPKTRGPPPASTPTPPPRSAAWRRRTTPQQRPPWPVRRSRTRTAPQRSLPRGLEPTTVAPVLSRSSAARTTRRPPAARHARSRHPPARSSSTSSAIPPTPPPLPPRVLLARLPRMPSSVRATTQALATATARPSPKFRPPPPPAMARGARRGTRQRY